MRSMQVEAPARSLEQRMAALEEANRIRSHRARVKRELAAGRLSMEAVLSDPDCETMRVIEVLLALPKLGRVKANRALGVARMSPSRTVGGMTERQRAALREALPRVSPATVGRLQLVR